MGALIDNGTPWLDGDVKGVKPSLSLLFLVMWETLNTAPQGHFGTFSLLYKVSRSLPVGLHGGLLLFNHLLLV